MFVQFRRSVCFLRFCVLILPPHVTHSRNYFDESEIKWSCVAAANDELYKRTLVVPHFWEQFPLNRARESRTRGRDPERRHAGVCFKELPDKISRGYVAFFHSCIYTLRRCASPCTHEQRECCIFLPAFHISQIRFLEFCFLKPNSPRWRRVYVEFWGSHLFAKWKVLYSVRSEGDV